MKNANRRKIGRLSIAMLTAALLIGGQSALAASFADNTLIRGEDRKIFVVENGERRQVRDLAELRRDFRGREIINVDNRTLAEIRIRIKTDNSGPGSLNSGRGSISGNSLIRGSDGKIFAVREGERRHIRTLTELRRDHSGRAIINVDDAALRRFPVALEDNPGRLFDDNRLIRDANGRIFVVENNALRQIADLNELRRGHLGQVIHNVNSAVLAASGVKLRGDGTVDDNSTGIRGLNDFVNGVKLRGDGSIDDNSRSSSALSNSLRASDDNLPRHSGLDDSVGGVKLRGDGTVDDNSISSGGGRISNDSSSSGVSSSGGDSGSSGRGGSGGGSDD